MGGGREGWREQEGGRYRREGEWRDELIMG